MACYGVVQEDFGGPAYAKLRQKTHVLTAVVAGADTDVDTPPPQISFAWQPTDTVRKVHSDSRLCTCAPTISPSARNLASGLVSASLSLPALLCAHVPVSFVAEYCVVKCKYAGVGGHSQKRKKLLSIRTFSHYWRAQNSMETDDTSPDASYIITDTRWV